MARRPWRSHSPRASSTNKGQAVNFNVAARPIANPE